MPHFNFDYREFLMMVQHLKRRPLSRYLKDFKHSQTHCAHCRKLLDRITLVRDGKIVNKIEISRPTRCLMKWLASGTTIMGGIVPILR